MAGANRASILAVDIGSENTRGLLFEIVDGVYQLAASGRGKTSIGAPRDDVSIGLAHVLDDIASEANRRFLDEAGQLVKPEREGGEGVDHCLVTASAGQPIRAILLGLQPKISIDAVMLAAAPFYLDIVAKIHLFDGMSERARLNRIVDSRADLIILSGGVDGGAHSAMLNMLGLLRQALSAMTPGGRPAILYAGNRDLAAATRDSLGQMAEVISAPNISPGHGQLKLEPLKRALSGFYGEFRARRGSGFQHVTRQSDGGIGSTAHGFERMIAFFGKARGVGVLGIDCGGVKSQIALAQGDRVRSALRHDIGLGMGAARLLELTGEEALKKWLPFQPQPGELARVALDKGLRAGSSPRDMRQRTIEYAFLRAAVGLLLTELDGVDDASVERLRLVITAGATLSGSGQGALDMLLLSEVLPLGGVTNFKCDRHGALPALGMLAEVEPAAVVQLLEGGVVEHVGSLVKAAGKCATGKRALTATVTSSTGENFKREVAAGEVWRVPLEAGDFADLRIACARGVTVDGKRRSRMRLDGGRGGILFDARLSPLQEDASLTERAINMLRWFAAVTGDDQPVVIPESWLAPAE